MCFHNRQKRNGHSWTCCYSNTICKCDGRNRLFHFFRQSQFKDCVAIAMRLIVALFFPFLIEVCWLFYFVVYSLCKITQLEKQDNRKCIFATDGILEENSVRRTFKCVATVTCLIMAAPHWCFCGVQWLFIHVIYIKCLGFWLERKDSWKRKFRPSQWWPILDLAHLWKWINLRGKNQHAVITNTNNSTKVPILQEKSRGLMRY